MESLKELKFLSYQMQKINFSQEQMNEFNE